MPGRHQPLKIDTSSQNFPLSVNLKLKAKHFYPLKSESKRTSEIPNEGCIDPKRIIEIRKDFNCTDSCIPIMFSSLLNMSMFKECPDFDSHFCAIEKLFDYLYNQGLKCTRHGVEKYFDGIVDMRHGTSYSQLLRHYYPQGDLTQIFPTIPNPIVNFYFHMKTDPGLSWVSYNR